MSVDAERFPPYLPERKGYFKMVFSTKENELIIPLTQTVVFFEIKNAALKRFKAFGTN